ncbi:ribonuclease Z [Bombilactobacillus thymidiniphilus]|uniref:Ribonuclease Z n=1 Tax=Bombilactobacillus thymidiniphilus TaxID=2923363 RepID=A0ABY4PD84_9LACO|nr:ribonuclease Z [Bombilactobacillus thymidiniphilus]UQS83734.1 ribonuclease Z [Bombilactobacillus thymidiniphilus]
MELEFLGTGSGVPSKGRNLSSVALKLLNERNEIWLFDAGEGTQQQILSTTIRPRKINKIFITHLHGDHIFGLPGLLSSRSFQGGEQPLTIYGPPGIKKFVQTTLELSDSHLSYRINYVEIKQPGVVFEDDSFKVTCGLLDHRIVCYGYRIEEKPHVGALLVDKLQQYQIPNGPIWGQIKRGEVVELADGTSLDGKDFIGPSQPGRIVTILGDTRYTKESIRLAQNADVLVHESTLASNEGKMAYRHYHSTSAQAAQIAKKAQVQQLLLTHISARYVGKKFYELLNGACQIFANSYVVKDFDHFEVKFRKQE